MSTNTPQDWFGDWQELSRRYWDGWKSQGMPAAAANTDLPWQAGFDQWAKLFGGASQQNDLLERINANSKAYISLMQSLLGSAMGRAGDGNAQSWTDALRNGFNIPGIDPSLLNNPLASSLRDIAGQGARGFEQLMGEFARSMDRWRQSTVGTFDMPAFGLAREHQERWQQLAAAATDYQEQTNRYNALLLKSSQNGFERFQSKLAEREEPGRQLESVRAIYDLWVDAAEEAYAEIALSEEFSRVYGAMVNAQMRVRSLAQKEVELQTRQLGMPTRSEVQNLEKSMLALRRELRNRNDAPPSDLASEVAALKAELAALRQQVGASASPVAATTTKPSKNSSKTKR
ncbi:class III poly(R)-hydroxyalkanoic acid synthase subunit PhaE [Tahibacter amnicola]|uniref:Poly(3-hydroxyalkanoate) polymerase subunit PhaE n=1 Tax=Tahibacter amnicola TaxID=2976241 RepID=A0ABY6BK27_9GAMM|nr:class III poly(R)-hydroxyalkanoic acid synthase subunit PhaE [Tahibacter amnicola]UXI69748.1 class III poly(R)-hydroxyalkanoic acid synthase subunit PhaE [Tahibacter amnicola]